jgi:hypothetical protein
MYVMSEISLPLLKTLRLRSFPSIAGRALGKLFGRRKGETAQDVGAQAASKIREYALEHAPLFEREERLRAKAERLSEVWTPSESADNRAERARMEIEAGLHTLRDLFAPAAGERRRAFDREVGRLYPRLGLSGR